ncbi:MAG TPA: hypothetical protein VFE78_36645 [Gemmataceae bacterium]|jgi:hypothetical protein|nr:hypothetical protein [Gemmataceae bacterium]
MHSAQGAPLASTAILVGPGLAEQEQTPAAAELPRGVAGEQPLRFGVASLEHWLDLNA